MRWSAACVVWLCACSPAPHLRLLVEDPAGAAAAAERLRVVNTETQASRDVRLFGASFPVSLVLTSEAAGDVRFSVRALRADGELLASADGQAHMSSSGARVVVRLAPRCTTAELCDDGDPCNGLERCEEGSCAPGAPPTLEDDDPCTVGVCTAVGVVQQRDSSTDGTACDLAVGGQGVCDAGSCRERTCEEDGNCPVCGNLQVEAGETCDDQNSDPCDGCDACTAITTYDCSHGICAPAGCEPLLIVHPGETGATVEAVDVVFTQGVAQLAVVERGGPADGDPTRPTIRMMRANEGAGLLESRWTFVVAERVTPPIDVALASHDAGTMVVYEDGRYLRTALLQGSSAVLTTATTDHGDGEVAVGSDVSSYWIAWGDGGANNKPRLRVYSHQGTSTAGSFTLWDGVIGAIDVGGATSGIVTAAWATSDVTPHVMFTVRDPATANSVAPTDLSPSGAAAQVRVAARSDGSALIVWTSGAAIYGQLIPTPYAGSTKPLSGVPAGVEAVDLVASGTGWVVVYLADEAVWAVLVDLEGVGGQTEQLSPTPPGDIGPPTAPLAAAYDGGRIGVVWNNAARTAITLLVTPAP